MTNLNGNGVAHNRLTEARPRAELNRVSSPTRKDSVLWVEKLAGSDVQKFVCVSPRLYGFCTHYTENGSSPCWQDPTLCEGGHKEDNLRENFLLQCWSLKKNKMVFLYLTPGAARQLEDQIQPGESLKGLPLIVERTSARNGRLNVRIGEFTSPSAVNAHLVDPWESVMVFCAVPKRIRDQRRALGMPTRPLYPTE